MNDNQMHSIKVFAIMPKEKSDNKNYKSEYSFLLTLSSLPHAMMQYCNELHKSINEYE